MPVLVQYGQDSFHRALAGRLLAEVEHLSDASDVSSAGMQLRRSLRRGSHSVHRLLVEQDRRPASPSSMLRSALGDSTVLWSNGG